MRPSTLGPMARTTIAIDDPVLRRLRQRAAREGRTLQDVVNALLRQGLAQKPAERYELRLEGWKGLPRDGVDLSDRDTLGEGRGTR